MPTITEISAFLEAFAPAALAEDWDNVGLLVGDGARPVERVMTCLTVTPQSAAEAVAERVGLIVTHHPLPFRPLKRLTTDSVEGGLLLDLIAAGVAIYSPHTAFDSARSGINQRLAEGLRLTEIAPLERKCVRENPLPSWERVVGRQAEASQQVAAQPPGEGGTRDREVQDDLGSGRFGRLSGPATLDELATQVKRFLGITKLKAVGPSDKPVRKVAVACGSAGQFLGQAREQRCDALVTGETSFHTCLEAEATGIGLLLTGHYASERFGVEALAEVLARQFPAILAWASRQEGDPIRWL